MERSWLRLLARCAIIADFVVIFIHFIAVLVLVSLYTSNSAAVAHAAGDDAQTNWGSEEAKNDVRTEFLSVLIGMWIVIILLLGAMAVELWAAVMAFKATHLRSKLGETVRRGYIWITVVVFSILINLVVHELEHYHILVLCEVVIRGIFIITVVMFIREINQMRKSGEANQITTGYQ